MKISFTIPLTIIIFQSVECAKILGVFPTIGKSHHLLASSLMRGLAERGHEVTIVSPFGGKEPPKNGTYKEIVTSEPTQLDEVSTDLFEINNHNFITFNLFMNWYGNFMTESTLSHPGVQALIKSDQHFDVVIIEQFWNDGLKVLAHHFQAPLVLFVSRGSSSWINPYVGNPAPPSYVAEQNVELNPSRFLHRLRNTIVHIFAYLNHHFLFVPEQNRIMKKYFPKAPDLDVLNYNASLVLLNSDWSTNAAVPRVPSMVDIGGFHLKPPEKLPQDLQNYLDGAKDGFVYFSMGSSLQSTNLPVEKREAFLRVFGKLKQKVLWKWESDFLPGQPKNVKLGKWLPQKDILAHPNIKAFITHGGLLSLTETVYHGVPILAIPVLGDQVCNAKQAETNGLGRCILYEDFSEDKLEETLNDVLNNPRYVDNMKRGRKIMRDRRYSPIDDTDYWIQYVVRHQGAPHLRVVGLELPWYQYLSLDVTLFILVTIIFGVYVFCAWLKLMRGLYTFPGRNKVKRS